MKPQRSANGTILSAAVLSAEAIAHERVLCPACMGKEFKMWPEGWDAYAAYTCKGVEAGTPGGIADLATTRDGDDLRAVRLTNTE